MFQRGNRAVARGDLSLSRIGPRIGSLPAHPFQAAPADQQRHHARQRRPSAKGRADEGSKPDHLRSGSKALTTPKSRLATSA